MKEAYEDEVTAKEERDTCEKEVKDRAAAELVRALWQILVWHCSVCRDWQMAFLYKWC